MEKLRGKNPVLCIYLHTYKSYQKNNHQVLSKREGLHIVSANTVATRHRLPYECDMMSLQDNRMSHEERKSKGLILNETLLTFRHTAS